MEFRTKHSMKNILRKLTQLNRRYKQLIMIFCDSIISLILILSAFSIRFGYIYLPGNDIQYPVDFWIIFAAPLIVIPVFYSFGLYTSVIRFIGKNGLFSIVLASTLYSSIWGLLGYMTSFIGIPRSVILINWMLSILVFISLRIFIQWFLSENKISSIKQNNVIIYGASSSGIELAQSLESTPEYKLVAYIDDNPDINSSLINGIKVFSTKDVSSVVKKYSVHSIFLMMPSISRRDRNKIINQLSLLSVHVRILPTIYELAEGVVKIEDLRKINLKDLLGRDSVPPNVDLLKTKISNKIVLITGAGGSIGSELSKQIIQLQPKKLILFDISESLLYQLELVLTSQKHSNIDIIPIIGSVRDYERMSVVFKFYDVETIYHAAAYKHVPLVEYNQAEGILNNSIGTMLAAKAANDSNVETFVLISTDKAVRPTNTMGVSKRIAELILQAFAIEFKKTCFTIVRFGNVLDSSGSVIPLFKKQIKEGGPITLTDKNIVRYFMTIPEAVELVIQAGAMAEGGDVFVLDMGKPVRIYDLALKMIQLSGLKLLDDKNLNGDIEIIYTGLRPGEKLFEELLVGDKVDKTQNKRIFRAEEKMIKWAKLEPLLLELQEACNASDNQLIRKNIIKIVPEFHPQSSIVDFTYKS